MSINPVIYIYFNGFYRKEFCRILKTLKSSGSELSLFLLVPILNFKAKLSKKTLKYTLVNVLFFDTFFARRPIKSLSVNHVTHKNCSTATSNVDIPQPPTMAYRSPVNRSDNSYYCSPSILFCKAMQNAFLCLLTTFFH